MDRPAASLRGKVATHGRSTEPNCIKTSPFASFYLHELQKMGGALQNSVASRLKVWMFSTIMSEIRKHSGTVEGVTMLCEVFLERSQGCRAVANRHPKWVGVWREQARRPAGTHSLVWSLKDEPFPPAPPAL
ncbi:uncharacterized protein LOC144004884 [Festucalex cinctus]